MKSLVATILFCICLAESNAAELSDQISEEQPQNGTNEDIQTEQGNTDDGQDSQSRTIETSFDRTIANSAEEVAILLQTPEQTEEQRDSSFTLRGAMHNLYQAISDGFPDTDRWGVATDLDIVGTWKLINKGEANQGQIFFHIEGRWDYGTTAPSTLGVTSLGSAIRTADSYNAYTPTFLPFRNFYWQQGSVEAGWTYRLGKVTIDQVLGTSQHLTPFTTFLPSGSIGINQPYPDSGLGAIGAWYFNDHSYILGAINDTNADRFGLETLSGDFYKAVEFGYKIDPDSERAGFSKLTIGHTDGTSDGKPANAALGPSGWGFTLKLEKELTADGRAIGILKLGKSTNDSAVYKNLASVHFLLYDPPDLPIGRATNDDLVGVGLTWAEPAIPGTQEETMFDIFYRFPLYSGADMTLNYQSVFNPALNADVDHASVFNLRVRFTF